MQFIPETQYLLSERRVLVAFVLEAVLQLPVLDARDPVGTPDAGRPAAAASSTEQLHGARGGKQSCTLTVCGKLVRNKPINKRVRSSKVSNGIHSDKNSVRKVK